MSKNLTKSTVAGIFISAFVAVGCTQLPTEKQKISDIRPQISFKIEGYNAKSARIIVDGLDMGVVSDFTEDKAAIRILPGTHSIVVTLGSDVLLEEKVYLGDGVNRSFIVKQGK